MLCVGTDTAPIGGRPPQSGGRMASPRRAQGRARRNRRNSKFEIRNYPGCSASEPVSFAIVSIFVLRYSNFLTLSWFRCSASEPVSFAVVSDFVLRNSKFEIILVALRRNRYRTYILVPMLCVGTCVICCCFGFRASKFEIRNYPGSDALRRNHALLTLPRCGSCWHDA